MRKKQRAAAEKRITELNDRALWILQNLQDDSAAYRARFGAVVCSRDLYEEHAFICSELGRENVLDN